ncbi:MAG: nitrous oxide-stimulated promoter family protein [Candidatus Binatia bacterium]
MGRLSRERRTIAAMITVYCRGVHRLDGKQCAECGALLSYAERRLERCPFEENKPPCAQCPIHCYQPRIREQMKAVMRYAGPRMMFRHPIFALRHWMNGFKKVPPRPQRRTSR